MEYWEKPRLRHCTIVADPEQSHFTLVVGRTHFQVDLAGDRSGFFALKSYFDGRHTVEQISEMADVEKADVLGISEAFARAGLLQQRSSLSHVDAAEFMTIVEDSSIMWRRQMDLHPLFGGLEEGAYRREVFLGLLVETYHYVRMLSPTLEAVARHWEPSRFRDVVLSYAEEEMDHHRAYKEVLDRVGRLAGHLETSHPTIGTLSLIRNFESIGRRSPLSLVCCLQLIEARPFEVEQAEQHLLLMARRFDLDDLVQPFLDHMKADIGFGHSNLLQDALVDVQRLSADSVHEAVNDMHDIKHCFDEFHDSVVKYYGDISNYIPRPKVDYFAL